MESWGPHPSSNQRRNWICPCVYVLQTTSQKEIFYGGVRTSCKKKRAGRAKFVVFSFTYWVHCRRRHRGLRCCSQDLSTCVNVRNSNTVLVKTPAICSLDIYSHVCYPRLGPLQINLLRFSANRHLGGEGKKIRCCRKIYIFQRNNQSWMN